jgi:F0F1-type ATP synthase membrane subunit a
VKEGLVNHISLVPTFVLARIKHVVHDCQELLVLSLTAFSFIFVNNNLAIDYLTRY